MTLNVVPAQYFETMEDVDTQEEEVDVVSVNLDDDESQISLWPHNDTNVAPVMGAFVATGLLNILEPKAKVMARLRVNNETRIVDEIDTLEPKLWRGLERTEEDDCHKVAEDDEEPNLIH